MKEKKYLICIILMAAVILLNLPLSVSRRIEAESRDNFAPFQNVMSLLLNKGAAMISFFGNAKEDVREKESMLKELAILRERVRSLEHIERENENLRKQSGFSIASKRELVLCEVVARGDISGWWQTVRLNKGRDDGIAPNMAVITMEGLIGKVMEVSRHTCDVLLITDPKCKVACKFSRTGAFGIVRGTGVSAKGDMRLEMFSAVKPWRADYIALDHEIKVYDEVVTSGFGGVYPEGLLIGYVRKVSFDPSGLYQCAEILPAAEMGTLKYVFVVVE